MTGGHKEQLLPRPVKPPELRVVSAENPLQIPETRLFLHHSGRPSTRRVAGLGAAWEATIKGCSEDQESACNRPTTAREAFSG